MFSNWKGKNSPSTISNSSSKPASPNVSSNALPTNTLGTPSNNPLPPTTISLSSSSNNLSSLSSPLAPLPSSLSSSSLTSSSSTNSLTAMNDSSSLVQQVNTTVNILSGQPINPNLDGGPPILVKFTRYLLSKGTTLEHIFKNHPELDAEVQIVKKNLLKDLIGDNIEQIQLSSFTNNTHVVSELLKQYVFSLPEPLFSYHLYDSFLLTHTILSQQDRLWAYRFLLAYLPLGYRGAIKNLLGLLNKIHSNHGQTKMDSMALASIFAPVFLRPDEEMYYMKSDRITIEEIIKLWIEEYDVISKHPTQPSVGGPAGAPPTPTKIFMPTHPSVNVVGGAFLSSKDTNQSNPSTGVKDDASIHPLSPLAHPTIGLKANQSSSSATLQSTNSSSNLTNATNPQQSPKLSLPTIPKQQNTQQTTTVIKVKPPLQASSSNNKSSPSSSPIVSSQPTPSSIQPTTSTTTTTNTTTVNKSTSTATTNNQNNNVTPNTSSSTLTPIKTLINNNNNGTNQKSTPPSTPTQPSTSTPSNNQPSSPNVFSSPPPHSTPSAPSTPTQSSSNNNNSTIPTQLTQLSTLDQETLEKINKVKGTTESLINDYVWQQLKSISSNIEKETNYTTTIRLSTVLRDSKRHLIDSSQKLLSISKSDVKLYLKDNPKPNSLNLSILSNDAISTNTGSYGEDLKHFELKRASHLATEELCDYIYFLKTKIHSFTYKEHIVLTAQIISRLKTILESGSSSSTLSQPTAAVDHAARTLGMSGGIPPLSDHHQGSSPQSSPSSMRRSIGSGSFGGGASSVEDEIKTTVRVVQVCSKEINDRVAVMTRELEMASLQGAVDMGKAIRSTKQTLSELYNENGYPLPADIKVVMNGNEDQLTTLKKTLEPLLERILSQVDHVSKIVNQQAQQNIPANQETKNIVDKLLFINKVLNL